MAILPGRWIDIAAHPTGGVVIARQLPDQRTVVVKRLEVSGEVLPIWSHTLPSPCLYLRVAVSPSGDVVVVGQDGRDGTGPDCAMWVVLPSGGQSIDGFGFGQYGVAIEWRDDRKAFTVYGARRRDFGVLEVTREGQIGQATVWPQPEAIAGTSQGWLDVRHGQLSWTDLDRLWPSPGSEQLVCPFTREGITVGQAPGDLQGMRAYGAGVASEITAESAFECRLAFDLESQQYAAAARLLDNRVMVAWCPPWPALPAEPVEPVEPPPVEPPPPSPPVAELAVTVIDYTREVATPGTVSLEYRIEGAAGHQVRVELLAGDDLQRIAESWAERGRLEARLSWAAGEYALVVRATSADGREARTGTRRIVRLVETPASPGVPPVQPPSDGDPHDALARRAFTDGVKQLYREVLGREADPSGLAHYVGELMAGRLTLDDLRTVLTNSKEKRS